MGPKMKTKDDLDMTFQVNYLSQFLLTTTLIREQQHKMTQELPLRVINLMSSGIAHTRLDFDDLMCEKRQRDIYSSYSASKLALMLFTCRLHHLYTFTTPARVHVMAVNPGKIFY